MKPDVEKAITEIRTAFAPSALTTIEDEHGGAHVLVEPVDLGPRYSEATRHSWIGFHIPFQYPFADVYPHHVRPDLLRADGTSPVDGNGLSAATCPGFNRPSIQISRRSNRHDPGRQTALLKLLKVVAWMGERP